MYLVMVKSLIMTIFLFQEDRPKPNENPPIILGALKYLLYKIGKQAMNIDRKIKYIQHSK